MGENHLEILFLILSRWSCPDPIIYNYRFQINTLFFIYCPENVWGRDLAETGHRHQIRLGWDTWVLRLLLNLRDACEKVIIQTVFPGSEDPKSEISTLNGQQY